MRWTRRHGLWITLALLALLLVLLGTLQYRWIGEIRRAEAERRQAQLERSARGMVIGLDRELAQAMAALRMAPGPQRDRATLEERLSRGAIAGELPLVSRLSLLSRTPAGEATLETCAADGSGCRQGLWTPPLRALRRRLLAGQGDQTAPPARWMRPGSLVESPLAVLVPVFDGTERPSRERRAHTFRIGQLLLVELDADYLVDRLLPQLAELHFGPPSESEFVVSVVRRQDRALVYSSDVAAAADPAQRGDLELALPGFAGHAAGRRGAPPGHPVPEGRPVFAGGLFGGGPGAGPGGGTADDTPWILVVRHRGGSLEQALAAAHRRNLAISLGVLALLGAAAVVLAIGAQRARGLARQQIELVASVTHELNTPLAALRSAGQNLAHGIVAEPAQVQRYGTLIDQESSRLAGLVAQVLDFAGIESGSRPYAFEAVSLARIVDEALAELSLVLEQAGLDVTTEVASALPELRGDPVALRRVVVNLLANAAKFAASGGRVAVRAAPAPGGRVVLRVEDAGPGVPPGERSRVFEPFYRGTAAQRNDRPGAGLGLALVRRIVTAHGGRTWIEDAPGAGTSVVVELPVLTGAGA